MIRESVTRAFACATVHDMFNWMTVILLVIIESITGFLEYITGAMVANMLGVPTALSSNGTESISNGTERICVGFNSRLASLRSAFGIETRGGVSKPPDFLKVLTKPFTSAIVQLNKKVRGLFVQQS